VGRPPAGLDEYLDWKQRLESYKASGLSLDVFCLQEGVSKSTYYCLQNVQGVVLILDHADEIIRIARQEAIGSQAKNWYLDTLRSLAILIEVGTVERSRKGTIPDMRGRVKPCYVARER